MNYLRILLTVLLVTTVAPAFGNDDPDTHSETIPTNPLIEITCSGKSGSTSLFFSFHNLNLETHHQHIISDDKYNYILDRSHSNPVLLIDSIRDLIARRIASYFNNIQIHLSTPPGVILKHYKEASEGFIQFLLQHFEQNWLIPIEQYHSSVSWLKFGYDYLNDNHFDFDKKYQLNIIGNLYFLNLRFDDIDQWESIIRSLPVPIDLSTFVLAKENMSQDKWYYAISQHFLREFTLTQEDFDIIVSGNAEELTHFYTDDEIQAFINKWKPKIRRKAEG